ncbi:MAG: glycosyltransferase family 1 protein [Chloroflexota bacterium]|nr:MAG: glycosyltransferase family 1 protein [Chloroflexota bacterium]
MIERRPVERVLQVHTRYRQPGGEDQVVDAERVLLETAGVDVGQVIFDNADLRESRSLAGDLMLAASAIWSRSATRRVRVAIKASRPQVVHVHNTFPAASPSVYTAAAAEGIPVVQTLHNYRMVCPAATTFRGGRACTDCVGKAIAIPAVIHACVRDSHSQSAAAAATLAIHRGLGTFARRIDLYLALTAFQRDLLVAGGLPAARVRVVPNFLEPDPGDRADGRAGIVFVGRLSPEKGLITLLDAAALVPRLVRVIGDGPLRAAVEAAAADAKVDYVGHLDRPAVHAAMGRALAVVVPSIWFEGFPIVLAEAFATGTPVIASRIGSLAELVEDGRTGLLAEPGDATGLADRLRWARDHPTDMRRMGQHARKRYESAYTGSTHLAALQDAYAAVARDGRAS